MLWAYKTEIMLASEQGTIKKSEVKNLLLKAGVTSSRAK